MTNIIIDGKCFFNELRKLTKDITIAHIITTGELNAMVIKCSRPLVVSGNYITGNYRLFAGGLFNKLNQINPTWTKPITIAEINMLARQNEAHPISGTEGFGCQSNNLWPSISLLLCIALIVYFVMNRQKTPSF